MCSLWTALHIRQAAEIDADGGAPRGRLRASAAARRYWMASPASARSSSSARDRHAAGPSPARGGPAGDIARQQLAQGSNSKTSALVLKGIAPLAYARGSERARRTCRDLPSRDREGAVGARHSSAGPVVEMPAYGLPVFSPLAKRFFNHRQGAFGDAQRGQVAPAHPLHRAGVVARPSVPPVIRQT